MKYALISPIEPREDINGNTGYRVAFVGESQFDVAPPLFWVECSDECVQDMWVYTDGELVEQAPPEVFYEQPVQEQPIIDNIVEL